MSLGVLTAPVFPSSGFLFATIKGELHEIHAAVSLPLQNSHRIRKIALNVIISTQSLSLPLDVQIAESDLEADN